MKIETIPGATVNLGAPKGWDPKLEGVECGALPAHYDGQKFTSQWRPTPEELERLNQGAPVFLQAYGEGHPPVNVYVPEFAEDAGTKSED